MRRIGTMNIKEILHHRHGLGLTRAQTATAVGVSTGTVRGGNYYRNDKGATP